MGIVPATPAPRWFVKGFYRRGQIMIDRGIPSLRLIAEAPHEKQTNNPAYSDDAPRHRGSSKLGIVVGLGLPVLLARPSMQRQSGSVARSATLTFFS